MSSNLSAVVSSPLTATGRPTTRGGMAEITYGLYGGQVKPILYFHASRLRDHLVVPLTVLEKQCLHLWYSGQKLRKPKREAKVKCGLNKSHFVAVTESTEKIELPANIKEGALAWHRDGLGFKFLQASDTWSASSLVFSKRLDSL
ncbi:hypothetical protein PoB_003706500 [Plakobranchus ocellatus]|uniref:Uncharacterized protein n=1 Tax=Plakobranchus ocellatus TaxID=259542 RepID=A0AAV4AUJ1_9GAST|nr:hypothetical protein PoB_003706500 [Plakobranchus ocellatus]